MGNLQIPENFNMKELYLDVSLKTCINDNEHDFTGKKTFNTSFYRENIGFGITDISIEINTSLQPIIEITFKDLYGNTLFGTQRGKNDAIDSSVLFNWPPPKFIFSFKGYLGRKVTWLLNLKTTNISFVPSDGSYEIKCTFVPNQWGFMADLPVLYLLACKKLRYEEYGDKNYDKVSENCIFETDSVFSYVRVGKRVETRTTEETKDFELLLKQLGSIKYGLSSAICGARVINLGEPIKGVINNIEIKGFTNLKVVLNGTDISDLTKLTEEYKNSSNVPRLDTFLQCNLQFASQRSPMDENYKYLSQYGKGGVIHYSNVKSINEIVGYSPEDVKIYKAEISRIIDENINAVNDEIKRRVFSSTKSQISKLTIGEVFRQIARDSAFILGQILQAGFEGYEQNAAIRDNGKKELIGRNFPLYINDKGEEVPAVQSFGTGKDGGGPSQDYGVEKYEMKFVEKFIQAIGEGIAENLISNDIAAGGRDVIQNRINNLEAIRPNPYKPFYSNIAENVLVRSGIIAFITRSSDPAKPGDYPYDNKTDRDTDPESIITLAQMDMENLSKDILSQLSYEDAESLKRFCRFFDRFISGDNDSGTDSKIGQQFWHVTDKDTSKWELVQAVDILRPYPIPIDSNLLKMEVNVKTTLDNRENSSTSASDTVSNVKKSTDNVYLSLGKLINELVPKTKGTISGSSDISRQNVIPQIPNGEVINSLYPPEIIDTPSFYNASFIDLPTLTAKIVVNNGLYWSLPKPKSDAYVFVLFDNPSDASKTREIQVQDATTESDLEGKGWTDVREMDPIGFIPIDGWQSVVHTSDPKQAITVINERILKENAINYSSCKNFYSNTDNYLQTKPVQNKESLGQDEVPAKNLTISIYTHIPSSEYSSKEARNLVFGPFYSITAVSDRRSINQRIAIKTMCKSILDKFDEIETEKNEKIASIFGKANESKNSLYKQMHTIFHQWQIMASSVAGQSMCEQYRIGKNESLGKILEREFGMCENHIDKGSKNYIDKSLSEIKNNITENSKTLFVYDYPLAPVNKKPISVKKSIINIEPLYKPNGNTTVLNIIQQICTKNNFVFVPFPGDANSDDINEVYKPVPVYNGDDNLMNYFHVIFTPTPETRTKLSNEENEFLSDHMSNSDFQNSAISIAFGAVDNQIIKSVNVGTDSTKPTAESILNLQRLVDKENSDHNVAMDCSMLPVYEGRSYKAKIDMIGNAQVYPMQYFYLQKMPMFGGLYQILKVNHSITPNDMSTSIEGVRMRFNTKGGYGGMPPITLDDLEALEGVSAPMELNITTSIGNDEDSNSYDRPYFFTEDSDIDYSKFEDAIESGFKNPEFKKQVEALYMGYVTSPHNVSFISKNQHEVNMKSVGWGTQNAWCSFFVKMIYSKILTGEQRNEALRVINGNTFQTVQNAKSTPLKYFKLTKTPSVGSYVAWENVKQDTKGVVKGHAGLVLEVKGNRMTVIEGNYGGGSSAIPPNLQNSPTGSHSFIGTYDATIGSTRDSNYLKLVAFITPINSSMGKEEVLSNIKKISTLNQKQRDTTILTFSNILNTNDKCFVVNGLSDMEKASMVTYLNNNEISVLTSDEKLKVVMYLKEEISC